MKTRTFEWERLGNYVVEKNEFGNRNGNWNINVMERFVQCNMYPLQLRRLPLGKRKYCEIRDENLFIERMKRILMGPDQTRPDHHLLFY